MYWNGVIWAGIWRSGKRVGGNENIWSLIQNTPISWCWIFAKLLSDNLHKSAIVLAKP